MCKWHYFLFIVLILCYNFVDIEWFFFVENKDKALLCGLLVCVELPPEYEEQLHEMYTYYPLMVLTGSLKLRKIVQMWFQVRMILDCMNNWPNNF